MSGRLLLEQSVQDRKRRRIETWLTSVSRASGPHNSSDSDDDLIELEAERPQRPPKRVRLASSEGHGVTDDFIQGKALETPPLTDIVDADVDADAEAEAEADAEVNAMASPSKAPQTPPEAQVNETRKRGNETLGDAGTGTGMDIDGELNLRASMNPTWQTNSIIPIF